MILFLLFFSKLKGCGDVCLIFKKHFRGRVILGWCPANTLAADGALGSVVLCCFSDSVPLYLHPCLPRVKKLNI